MKKKTPYQKAVERMALEVKRAQNHVARLDALYQKEKQKKPQVAH